MWDLFLFPSYSQLIAEWPVAVLLLCLAVILLCTLAGLLGGQLPDFSKPLLVRDQGEGWAPRPGHLSCLGQKMGVAQLGVGRQQWALHRELGDGIEVILVSNNPGRRASLPCSRDPKGQS